MGKKMKFWIVFAMYFLNSTYTQIDTVVLNSLTVHCLNFDHNYAVVNPN